MHSLDVIVVCNVAQVHKEFDGAVDEGDLNVARQIAKANPDLYVQDGRRRVPSGAFQVVAVASDGTLICEDETGRYNCGETLEEFGPHNLFQNESRMIERTYRDEGGEA